MKSYCTQNNGNCRTCSLSSYGRDCTNSKLSNEVTADYRVDQYGRVYDAGGVFFCTYDQLSDDEQAKVKLNPMSAR